MYSNPPIINKIDMCKIGWEERNDIKDAIENNDPIEENLHCIAVISNPANFKKRYKLMREFIRRMDFENNVILYVCELAYGNQPFAITSSDNPKHLQLRTKSPLWHKENMINLAVQKLLPPGWKAFAWIDADIEFTSNSWALDALKILNGAKDIVQLFSHCVDMDEKKEAMNIFNSFGFNYCMGLPYAHTPPVKYWHTGYAWGMTKKSYEKMGGLFELAILGSGDHIISRCLMNWGLSGIDSRFSDGFKQRITEFENKVKRLRVGYVPNTLRHYYHGSKVNRKYVERNDILLRYNYNPVIHIEKNSQSVIIPSAKFKPEFLQDILEYFKQRNEDET